VKLFITVRSFPSMSTNDIHSFYLLECLLYKHKRGFPTFLLHTQLHELVGGEGCIKTVRFSYIWRKVLLYIQIHLCISSVSIHPLRSLRKNTPYNVPKILNIFFWKTCEKVKILYYVFSLLIIVPFDLTIHQHMTIIFVQKCQVNIF
jgi:hypothetical protein